LDILIVASNKTAAVSHEAGAILPRLYKDLCEVHCS